MVTAPDRVEAVTVAVLAKAPLAGQAKTRLAPELGPAGAARAHRALVLRTLQTVAQAGLPVRLWCAPSVDQRFFRALTRTQGLALATQPEGDVGVRMHAAFVAHARCSSAPMLLIGTDCPAFDAAHLRQAARRLLAGDEAVFTPAEDGGYVLVGLRRPVADLFNAVSWSTAAVMGQTRAHLRRLGLRWSEMPTLWDVDRPADWQRWQGLQALQALKAQKGSGFQNLS
jgi:rSAM/selenodomain-associated transferase 1